MAIGNAEIELSDQGYVSVKGINKTDITSEDDKVSNGSGKSCIPEAIVYALTGQTMRGTRDVQNYYTKEDCRVEIEFESKDKVYRIVRVKGKSLDIYENDVDISGKGIRETQEIIDAMFPQFNQDYLGATIVIAQGMPNAFTNNSGAKRKEILETLTKSDYQIEDIKEKLTRIKATVWEQIRQQENVILTERTRKEIAENAIHKGERELDMIEPEEPIKKRIQEHKAKEAEALKCAAAINLDEIEKRGSDMSAEIAKQNVGYEKDKAAAIEKAQLKVREVESQIAQYRLERQAVEKEKGDAVTEAIHNNNTAGYEYNSRLNKLEQQYSTIQKQAKIETLENEVRKIESISGVCPTCGKPLDGFERPSTEKQRNEIAVLKKECEEMQNEYSNKQQELMEEIKIQKEKYQSAIDVANDDLTKERTKTNEGLKDLQKAMEDSKNNLELVKREWAQNPATAQMEEKLKEYRREYVEKRQQKRMYEETAARERDEWRSAETQLQMRIDRINNIRKVLSENNAILAKCELHIIDATNASDKLNAKAELVNKMYSYATKEFRTALLEDTISILEQKAKKLCKYVFGDSDINFRQEGANIFIGYRNKPIENLSGGESQLVKLIIQLALRDTLIALNGEDYNMIWLDEIFDALDAERAGKAVELAMSLNTDSIFIISHHDDLQLPSDHELIVEKQYDVASVRMA